MKKKRGPNPHKNPEDTAQCTESRESAQPGCFADIWRTFGSIKVAIGLLIVWACFSVPGTVVPQSPDVEDLATLQAALETDFGPTFTRIILKLRLYDVYHSPWYNAALFMLCFSIFVCTVNRSGAALRRVRRPRIRSSAKAIGALGAHADGTADVPPKEISSQARRYLSRLRYDVRMQEDDSGIDLIARRGAIKHIGPMLVHISVLLVFLGAVYGRNPIFGSVKTLADLREGRIYHEVHSDRYIELNSFEVPFRRGDHPDLTVAVDYVSHVTVYEPADGAGDREVRVYRDEGHHSGEPVELIVPVEELESLGDADKQALAAMESHDVSLKELSKEDISVNHPLAVGGTGFYQSSWGMEAQVRMRAPEPEVDETADTEDERPAMPTVNSAYWILPGGEAPGFETTIRRVGIGQHPHAFVGVQFAQGGDNQATPVDGLLPQGPSLLVAGAPDQYAYMNGNFDTLGWLTPSHPLQYGDVELSIEDVGLYTVLNVKRDPGLVVVMVGFGLSILGLAASFYVPLRQVRVKIIPGEGDSHRVVAGASTGPDDDGAEELVAGLVKELKLSRHGRDRSGDAQ